VPRSLRTAKKGRDALVKIQELTDQSIVLRPETRAGVLQEIAEAYKDIDAVVNVIHNAGLARKVARLKPIGAIKGQARDHPTRNLIPR
jgi:RNA-splicing ligase RtcB